MQTLNFSEQIAVTGYSNEDLKILNILTISPSLIKTKLSATNVKIGTILRNFLLYTVTKAKRDAGPQHTVLYSTVWVMGNSVIHI
jgi:hypothetical protein